MLDWNWGKILKSYNLKYSKMHCAQCGINIAVEDHYCFAYGARKLASYDQRDENDFIEYYFKRGFRYESILVQLDIHHKIKMSLSTLKRHFKELGLNKSHATASAAVKADHREGNKRPVHVTWLSEYVEQIENNL